MLNPFDLLIISNKPYFCAALLTKKEFRGTMYHDIHRALRFYFKIVVMIVVIQICVVYLYSPVSHEGRLQAVEGYPS